MACATNTKEAQRCMARGFPSCEACLAEKGVVPPGYLSLWLDKLRRGRPRITELLVHVQEANPLTRSLEWLGREHDQGGGDGPLLRRAPGWHGRLPGPYRSLSHPVTAVSLPCGGAGARARVSSPGAAAAHCSCRGGAPPPGFGSGCSAAARAGRRAAATGLFGGGARPKGSRRPITSGIRRSSCQ